MQNMTTIDETRIKTSSQSIKNLMLGRQTISIRFFAFAMTIATSLCLALNIAQAAPDLSAQTTTELTAQVSKGNANAIETEVSPHKQSLALSDNLNSSDTNNIYAFANHCYVIGIKDTAKRLSKNETAYTFSEKNNNISQFTMRPSALGIYLLFDQDQQFLIGEDDKLLSVSKLESEMTKDIPETITLLSSAEWQLHSKQSTGAYHLQHLKSQAWLSESGLNSDAKTAASLSFKPSNACAKFPESETGASGKITKTTHEDGMLWGFVDAHEHIGANHGFGGQVFHGSSFHKLGVEHALADCEKHHGVGGSKDLMHLSYKSGAGNIEASQFFADIFNHLVLNKPSHESSGYPELTDWAMHRASTHQSLYYKWIERAYLGGMRLLVEYMESTEVVCEINQTLFSRDSHVEDCNEMVHVDHQLQKMKELQNYIDAQAGGPGKGWLRIVYSPEEARQVIQEGKLALVLGIEIENPFDCFIDGRDGFEPCDEDTVRGQLNEYYDKGVRALFPSHKFINAFSSGDGDPGILELGDYSNGGNWRDYVACEDVPGNFSMGSHGEGKKKSLFAGLGGIPGLQSLNKFLSGDDAGTGKQALPIYPKAEAHCQRNGFTPLGLSLVDEMMALGMIIDLGHTPKPALNDILPILVESGYPAVHTHGGDQTVIKLINGLSTRGLGGVCRDTEGKADIQDNFKQLTDQINPETGLPINGLSYDFNGFASYAKPRFGDLSECLDEQKQPLEYPFTSFAGDVVLDKLQTGNRSYDFNTEGLANIGLLPDLIEEARRSGVNDAEISALFKTAEAYIRIWERAESLSKQP